ncbi:MAG: hypothetical protein WAQ98_21275 [Blastocatellia bacterium]
MAHPIGRIFRACNNTINNFAPPVTPNPINPIQRFSGILSENGELIVTGTNLLSLTPSVIYTSKPKDANCHLYIEVMSDTQAIIKNTGEKLNTGVSVKGKFE